MQREAEVRAGKAVGSGLSTTFTPMSNKPPVGLRPRWLVLSDRADEIRAAIKRYDEQALICPVDWVLELQEIERQLAILVPGPEPEPVDEPAARAMQSRRFVSISRTILNDGDHILDAIDDQGTAWWRRLDTSPHHPVFPTPEPEWQQLSPLPSHEVPAR